MNENIAGDSKIKKLISHPKRSIIGLSIPMIISLLLTIVNNIADAMWVSGLGANALAAIGIVTPLFIITIGVGVGLTAGVNSSVARFIGAKKFKEAGNSSVHGLILSVIVSIIIPLVIIIFMNPLICIIGGAKVLTLAREYCFWIMLGSFSVIVTNVFSGVYRSENKRFKSTAPLAVSAILNIILDPIFIYPSVNLGITIPGLNFGVAGAAIATVLANIIGLLIYLYWTYVRNDTIIDMRTYHRSRAIYKDITDVAVPASMEQILMSIFSMVINVILVMVASTTSVAIFTTVWRIVSIGIMIPVGIGTGAISIFGALYGAKMFKKIMEMFKFTHIIGFIATFAVATLIALSSNQIALLFGGAGLNTEIAQVTVLLSAYVVFSSLSIISGFIFQSFGKGSYSLFFTLLKQIILTIICIFCFISLKDTGVYYGIILANFIGGIIEITFAYLYTRRLLNYYNNNFDEVETSI